MSSTFYPCGIECGGARHERVLKTLKTKFDERYQEAKNKGLPLKLHKDNTNPHRREYKVDENGMISSNLALLQNKQHVPIFGATCLSVESTRMLAALDVFFTSGHDMKILTTSGDSPINVRQFFQVNELILNPPKEGNKIFDPLKLSAIDGYTFYNEGGEFIGKYVINLRSGKRSENQKYLQSCAAQKALWVIDKEMVKNSKLRVNKIVMTEVMWTPETSCLSKPKPSCKDCEKIFPIAFPNN